MEHMHGVAHLYDINHSEGIAAVVVNQFVHTKVEAEASAIGAMPRGT